jgi:hypothetical protein
MLMTLLIFGVVLAVIGNVFFSSQRLYGTTQQRAEQQMSARAGLTVMVEEIRRAGADPEAVGLVGLVRCTQDTVRVRAELNDVAGIQTTEPSEDVTYYYDPGLQIVYRDNGTGPQPMITNVTNFQLEYYDENNQLLAPLPLTTDLADAVRSIGLTITTETNQGGEVAVATRVGLRNM